MPGADWTREEVEATVADYFGMLELELSAAPYSKADHNRLLQARIGRSKGAIEFKHQNISAVLINFRQPFIRGYLPRQNYQALLEQVVLEWLATHPQFFASFADGPILAPVARPPMPGELALATLVEEPPPGVADVEPGDTSERAARFYRIDFVRRDAENRKLGRMGEEWVVEFEQRRLHDEARRPDLARKVEWIADTRGDGAGYDIQSFNADASPRLIEVKTTGLGKQFPFMVTANEVRVSAQEAVSYSLYRVFDFSTKTRLYMLPGSLVESCRLEPTQFRARTKAGQE